MVSTNESVDSAGHCRFAKSAVWASKLCTTRNGLKLRGKSPGADSKRANLVNFANLANLVTASAKLELAFGNL
jgi:hypothetical protein